MDYKNIDLKKLPAFTVLTNSDGACKATNGHGKGAWGYITRYLTLTGTQISLTNKGVKSDTTAPEMEVFALYNAFDTITVFENKEYIFLVDNDYVAKTLVKNGSGVIQTLGKRPNFTGYVSSWMKTDPDDYKKWKKADKKPIAHVEKWFFITQKISLLCSKGNKVHISWVPREYNSVADKIANAALC